jgi:Ca2+-binding EF-hand superfamily protein
LTGSWGSTEITHPSPFFSDALDSNTGRNVRLVLDQYGTFRWFEPEGICHSGTYLIQDHALLLTAWPGEERIRLDYTFRGDDLRLKSPDGFIFEFRKTPHQANAGANPCNR